MNAWERFKKRFGPNAESEPETPEEACFWKTDMHSHLLPGVDDGVKDADQTLACLQQLAAWGIRQVITTPHVSRDWYPNTSDTLRNGQATLQQLADTNNVPIRIDVAAEYMLDDFFPSLLAEDDLLSFGTERYVLIETGWASAPNQLETILFRMQTRGYTPVLAHPERYTYYHENQASLARLHEVGCLFQLNWPSLTGRYGSKVKTQAQRFLKNNWVDFIGSDLHRPTDLPALAALFTLPEYDLLRSQPLRNSTLFAT